MSRTFTSTGKALAENRSEAILWSAHLHNKSRPDSRLLPSRSQNLLGRNLGSAFGQQGCIAMSPEGLRTGHPELSRHPASLRTPHQRKQTPCRVSLQDNVGVVKTIVQSACRCRLSSSCVPLTVGQSRCKWMDDRGGGWCSTLGRG